MAGETTTSTISNLVQTAYDRFVEYALRAQPVFRSVVDKFPVDQAMPGSAVKLSIHSDLAAATTPLTEATDPTPTTLNNPSQVTLTYAEYGNTTKTTWLARNYAFSEIEPAVLNEVAWNMVDTLDVLALTAARQGTNVVYSTGAAPASFDTTGPTNTVIATDVLAAPYIRYVVAKLRGANALPRKAGLYAAYTHPDTSYSLRADSGATTWRDPHVYQSNEGIWTGEIGAFEGAFFIETPRAYQANDGTTSAKVTRTLIMGQQALAESVAGEPQLVLNDSLDSLKRFKYVGWKAIAAWAVYRQAALWRIETGSPF